MVGKKSLTALCCASALLLTGAGSACAADDGIPFEELVEVTVANQGTADKLVTNYDAAEYKRVNDDGIDHAQRLRHRRGEGRAEGQGLQDRRARSRTPTRVRSA